MDINYVLNVLSKVATISKISNDEYEIVTEAKINLKTPMKIFLNCANGSFSFNDRKNTLKFMNNVYELKSLDVKNCIGSVIKIYGFTIVSGELIATIHSQNEILEKFYNFIMCIGQLVNMYAFFDNP